MLQNYSFTSNAQETEASACNTQLRKVILDSASLSTLKGPRCSIFQDLAGDYRVDGDDDDDVLSVQLEYNNSCLSLSINRDHLSTRRREVSTSALSFTQNSVEQGIFLLQQYEGPIGWECNHISDLFDAQLAPINSHDSTPCLSTSSSTTSSPSSIPLSSSSSSETSSTKNKSIYTGKSPSISSIVIRNITQVPSKACSALFRRNSSKISPLGISNYDEPIRYLVSNCT